MNKLHGVIARLPRRVISATLLAMTFLGISSLAHANTDAYMHYIVGLQAERRGDIATALSEYQKTVDLDPGAVEAFRDLAQLNLRTGRTDAALSAAEKVKVLAPQQSSSFLFLGNVHVVRGDLDKAVENYEQALKLNPRDLQALQNLGHYYASTNSPKAVEYYQKYLTYDPRNAEIYFHLGLYYQRNNKIDQAMDAYKKSKEQDPQEMAPRMALAENYERSGSTEAAIAEYETALKIDPRNAPIYQRLGKLYQLLHQSDKAASAFQNARAIEPKEPSNPYWLARIAEEKRDWKAAADYAGEAYTVSQDSQFLTLWAYYLSLDNRSKEAVMVLEKARVAQPSNTNVLLFLGMGYLDTQKPEKAVAVLEKGVELSTADAQMQFQLGVAYDKLGKQDAALLQFNKVLQLDPRNAAAMNYIGYTYAEQGVKLPEAEALLRKANALDPDSGAYMDSLGWVLHKEGQSNEAIPYLIKASEKTPDALIFDHLGDAYAGAQQTAAALSAWTRARALSVKDKTLDAKIADAASRVIAGSGQRKFLKYMQGNARQILNARATLRASGRWQKQSVKMLGRMVFERPDAVDVSIDGPSGEVLATVRISADRVRIDPAEAVSAWAGFSLDGLTVLPRYFSGSLFDVFDSSNVKTDSQNGLTHYAAPDQEMWVDFHRGVLTRYTRTNLQGGVDDVTILEQSLEDGLWMPRKMKLKNKELGWKAELNFLDWKVNTVQEKTH